MLRPQTQSHLRRGKKKLVSSPPAAAAAAAAAATTSATTTTTSTTRLFSTTNIGQILGGDYAGQSATFSSIDGKLIPVPEHYVPNSMIEWGQVPNYLEVIVSEDFNIGSDTGSDSDTDTFERNTVTVMPEVGCGLDNLDTIKTKVEVPMDSHHYHRFQFDDNDNDDNDNGCDNGCDTIKVATMFVTEGKRRIECMFVHDDEQRQRQRQRTRVCINLHENDQLKSPIEIIREHMTSETSSRGTIANGGGLDARTVTQLVGRENISKPFCQEEVRVRVVQDSLDGGWRQVVCQDGERLLFAGTGDDDMITTLNLPSGVQVRHCTSPSRMIEVSWLESDEDGLPARGIAVLYNVDIDGTVTDTGTGSTPTVRCYNNGETKTRK